jgi:RNA polymerase sigma-70 factor (ECF subfamily)
MKLANSILRDRQDAEDEVQNACAKAYIHIGTFQRDAKFSTWLSRIVVNQCLMRLRQRRRARFVYIDDTVTEAAPKLDLPDGKDTPETSLARSELSQILHREIGRIPPILRKPFLLREMEKLSLPEVADRLGISEAAAKSRLLRARRELRSRLARFCGSVGAAAQGA